MTSYDLHTHTTASDGSLRPEESVELARSLGLAGIAVTDHDTVAGLDAAMGKGRKVGIEVVPGVEITTSVDEGDVHMLGLWVDPADEMLVQRLASNRETRRRRNELMIRSLNSLGMEITLEEAEALAAAKRKDHDRSVSRPHLAELLVRKGYVGTLKEAFDLYLGSEGKAFVQVSRISPEEAIRWIHEAGGAAVIAHPGIYRGAPELIKRLAKAGLDGVEAAHPDHGREREALFRGLALEYGLIATGGSDFHGFRDGIPYHSSQGAYTTDSAAVAALKGVCRSRKKEMP